jgi:hypothetical protein
MWGHLILTYARITFIVSIADDLLNKSEIPINLVFDVILESTTAYILFYELIL